MCTDVINTQGLFMKKLINKLNYERNILIINSLLIAIFISSNITINFPLLSYENILLALLSLNVYLILRVVIEWFQAKAEVIYLLVPFVFGLASSGYITYEINALPVIFDSTMLSIIGILLIGEAAASIFSTNMQYLVYTRSMEESSQSYLPLIPFALKSMLIQIPISLTLFLVTAIGIYFVLDDYSLFMILFLPLCMHILALVIYFLFLDKEQVESTQKTLDNQDKEHILNKIGKRLSNKESTSCRKTSVLQYETVIHFLNNGLDPNKVFEDRYTLLLPSTCCGDNKLVELLIDKGADVNFKSSLGTTALHLACQHGSYHLAQILVQNGAKIDVKDAQNKTALDYANELDDKDLAEMLVEETNSLNQE